MSEHRFQRDDLSPTMRRAISKWAAQAVAGLVGYAAIIFVSVGRLNWIWGWALVAVLVAFMAAHPILLLPRNPDLLVERGKGTRAEGVKSWDKWITGLSGALMIVAWIVAGLDDRLVWSGGMPLAAHLAGLVGLALGYSLFLWAMTANAFFSEGVRIQTDRDHAVASGGPYRFVRHPGYVGVILSHLATPFLLGSIWALLPGGLLAAVIVLRTHLEDRTLMAELPGYEAYARTTRFRLLPGVW